MKIKVLIHPAEKGGFGAEMPALPGCYSQGETIAEMLENNRELIDQFLAEPKERLRC